MSFAAAAGAESRVAWARGVRLGGLRLRLSAVWHSNALGRELADGVDPRSSAVLALRAQKLTDPRGRERIADGLAGARRSAEDTRPGISAAVRPDARELLEARTVSPLGITRAPSTLIVRGRLVRAEDQR